jgi:hypothetical protein
MLKSYTGFQRLRKCVVGRSYPPEFYSWITNPRLRLLFETIADETEEDYLKLIKKLNGETLYQFDILLNMLIKQVVELKGMEIIEKYIRNI